MEQLPERAVVDRWFEAHGAFLYTWLRARLGAHERGAIDLEDLLQEVWLRAVVSVRNVVIENPRGWLLTVASRVFLEALRARLRRARHVDAIATDTRIAEIPAAITTITRRIAREELRQQFLVAIDKLDDEDRVLLTHHGLEGRLLSEVARTLGITPAAASKRWQRLCDHLAQAGSPTDLFR